MDVKTTFLYGGLEEELYVVAKFLVMKGKDVHVSRLKKSLYDLKQLPRMWYKFDTYVS